MKIRNVNESDLEVVAPLACTVNKMHVDAYPDIYKMISVETAKNLLASKINNRSVVFRLAENESYILGYYSAEIRDIEETDLFKALRFIYLAEIMVSPDSQGSGVGQALMADLKIIARGKKINRIELDVSGFNAKAITFFKGQGFDLLRERMSSMINP